MVDSLRRTFANEIADRPLVIVRAALGAFNGKAIFGFNAEFPAFGQLGETANSEEVEVRTLKSIVDEFRLTQVNFIKMDIEGAEMQAVEGALPIIRKFRPKLSITTYHRTFDFACLAVLIDDVKYRRVTPVGLTHSRP